MVQYCSNDWIDLHIFLIFYPNLLEIWTLTLSDTIVEGMSNLAVIRWQKLFNLIWPSCWNKWVTPFFHCIVEQNQSYLWSANTLFVSLSYNIWSNWSRLMPRIEFSLSTKTCGEDINITCWTNQTKFALLLIFPEIS